MGGVSRVPVDADRRCCLCGREVSERPVEFVVHWQEDAEPARLVAHRSCVADKTSIEQLVAARGKR